MGLFSSILKIGGGALGNMIAPGIGGAIGSSLGGALGGAIEGGGSTGQAVQAARQAGQVQSQAFANAQNAINKANVQGQAQFDPFRAVNGVSPSFQLQRAFSGALGPKAQQTAFDNFKNDPGTAFLRQRGTATINRNAAALGGLGGGNRLKRLSEFNQGLALQSFNNRVSQLNNVTNREFNAGSNSANVGVGLSNSLANSIIGGGAARATGIVGAQNARISGNTGVNKILGQATNNILNSLNFGGGNNTAPSNNSTVFNVPSSSSFSGGFPASQGPAPLTFDSSIGSSLGG